MSDQTTTGPDGIDPSAQASEQAATTAELTGTIVNTAQADAGAQVISDFMGTVNINRGLSDLKAEVEARDDVGDLPLISETPERGRGEFESIQHIDDSPFQSPAVADEPLNEDDSPAVKGLRAILDVQTRLEAAIAKRGEGIVNGEFREEDVVAVGTLTQELVDLRNTPYDPPTDADLANIVYQDLDKRVQASDTRIEEGLIANIRSYGTPYAQAQGNIALHQGRYDALVAEYEKFARDNNGQVNQELARAINETAEQLQELVRTCPRAQVEDLVGVIEKVYENDAGIEIYALVNEDRGGGTNGHNYGVFVNKAHIGFIEFQNGPIPKFGANGFTNEALIAVIIHRTKHVNGLFPSEENVEAIGHLEQALAAFDRRTANRRARQVEGTLQA